MTVFSEPLLDYYVKCSKMNRWRCNIFYFLVGAAASALILLDWARVLGPEPYGPVTVLKREQVNGTFYLTTKFDKLACTFNRLIILGVMPNLRQDVLDWKSTDADRNPAGPTRENVSKRQAIPGGKEGVADGSYDRQVGEQIWHVAIKLPDPLKYQFIEIRTRHICDGQSVDRIFLKVRI